VDRKRILLVIFDGLGDRPVKELGNKTPLQTASTPNLDWFAANGACGLLDPIGPGIRPGSDTSHLALFGYDPERVYTGRGPFEAAGVGIEVRPGDIAFRCNFATADADGKITDRRAGRIREGTAELAKELDGLQIDGARVFFRAGTEHRAALVLRGPDLSPEVSDTDPHEEGARLQESLPRKPEAGRTARVLNEFSARAREILDRHWINDARRKSGLVPANAVVTRGAGLFPRIPTMRERWGMTCAGIAGVALIRGICRSLGMDVLEVSGATGGLDTDMVAKAASAVNALRDYEFVAVNVKAPDLCGHDGLALEKVRVMERIDEMMGSLRASLREDTIVALTADHSTPVSVKDHSGDPVPLAVFGEGVRVDAVTQFDEIAVAGGSLGRLRGRDLMPVLFSLANRAEKFGA
jgi:2,3-bisphosphoglycerate-independent phosphoglycerate mutase